MNIMSIAKACVKETTQAKQSIDRNILRNIQQNQIYLKVFEKVEPKVWTKKNLEI